MAIVADKIGSRYLPQRQTVTSDALVTFCGDLSMPFQNRDAVENYAQNDYIAIVPQFTRIVEAKLLVRHLDPQMNTVYTNPSINQGVTIRADVGLGEGANPILSNKLDLDPATVAEGDQALLYRSGTDLKHGRAQLRYLNTPAGATDVKGMARTMRIYLRWECFEKDHLLTDVTVDQRNVVNYWVSCFVEQPSGFPMKGSFDGAVS